MVDPLFCSNSAVCSRDWVCLSVSSLEAFLDVLFPGRPYTYSVVFVLLDSNCWLPWSVDLFAFHLRYILCLRGLASAERVFALVDRVPAVAGDEGLEPSAEVVGDLEFRDVWFQYQNRDKVSQSPRLISPRLSPALKRKHVLSALCRLKHVLNPSPANRYNMPDGTVRLTESLPSDSLGRDSTYGTRQACRKSHGNGGFDGTPSFMASVCSLLMLSCIAAPGSLPESGG